MDNLSQLYSIDDGSFIFSDKDGNEYKKNMFIPSMVAVISNDADNYKDDSLYQHDIISAFLSSQYDFMTSEWVRDNIDLGQQNEIFFRIKERSLRDQEVLKKRLERMTPERSPKGRK